MMEQETKLLLSEADELRFTKPKTLDLRPVLGQLVYCTYRGIRFLAKIDGYRYSWTKVRLIVPSEIVEQLGVSSDCIFNYYPWTSLRQIAGVVVVRFDLNDLQFSPVYGLKMVQDEPLITLLKQVDGSKVKEDVVTHRRFSDHHNNDTWSFRDCPILHQKQSLDNSCVSACIAMVTNRLDEDVVEEFHVAYTKGATISSYFKKHRIPHRVLPADSRDIATSDEVYLATVPSLNKEGGFHSVVLVVDDNINGVLVFDPQTDRKDKRFYSTRAVDDDNPNAVALHNYRLTIAIPIEDVRRMYASTER